MPTCKVSDSAYSTPVLGRAVRSIVWTAGSTWVQLGLSLATFAMVAAHLTPSQVGAFGVAQLVCSFVTILLSGPFNDALQQREGLHKDHVDATFWAGQLVAGALVVILVFAAPAICGWMHAPQAVALLRGLCLIIPMSLGASTWAALLSRDLKLSQVSIAGSLSVAVAGLVSVMGIMLGLGVLSLVLAELVRVAARLILLAASRAYQPAWPKRWDALGDLMRFNLSSFGLYLVGYGDRVAPRTVVGLLLGPTVLGYYLVAERTLDLLSQLVLNPLGSVTMTAVARVQQDRQSLQALIRHLYALSTLVGYPTFIGAIVLLPVLAEMLGGRWLAAILPAQILLLVGLRTTTGTFNLSILRGVGKAERGLILLGGGFLLQLALAPLGAWLWGATGVAVAVLVRTYAMWPIGCWLVRRVTDIPVKEQLTGGASRLAAATVMAGVMLVWLHFTTIEVVSLRLLAAVVVGSVAYAVALVAIAPSLRGGLLGCWRVLRQSGPHQAWVQLQVKAGLADMRR